MLRYPSLCLPALLLLAAGTWSPSAQAQVRRCEQPDGDVTYTDDRCAEIGAVEQPAGHGGDSRRLYRGACPRTLPDLMFEMSLAIDAHDVNRLASLYHWAGMSSGAANEIMDRLDALVQQPLVDIVPVMAAPPGGYAGYGQPSHVRSYSATPVAVRVEQTLADSITPARTVFALHQYFGCLWLRDGSAIGAHRERPAQGTMATQ